MDIEDIDFNDRRHQILIMTLSKKNNYHINTLSVNVMNKIPNHLISMFGRENVISYFKNKNAFYCEDKNYKGYLMFIDKKAIGFVLFFDNEIYSILEYLLIDKEYQLNGYGRILLQLYIINSNDKLLIKIKEEDIENDSYKFYKKIGFEYGYEIIDKLKNDNPLSAMTLLLCHQSKKSLYYRIISQK